MWKQMKTMHKPDAGLETSLYFPWFRPRNKFKTCKLVKRGAKISDRSFHLKKKKEFSFSFFPSPCFSPHEKWSSFEGIIIIPASFLLLSLFNERDRHVIVPRKRTVGQTWSTCCPRYKLSDYNSDFEDARLPERRATPPPENSHPLSLPERISNNTMIHLGSCERSIGFSTCSSKGGIFNIS